MPPWDGLALLGRVMPQAPDDPNLLFGSAACLGRVGLRTLALAHVERMPEQARAHEAVRALRQALLPLPDDRLEESALRNIAAGNAGRLAARGIAIGVHRAVNVVGAWRWYRALDGNIIRVREQAGKGPEIKGLFDARGAARRDAAELCKPANARDLFLRPVTIEGVCPPWLALEVHRATSAGTIGHTPRLWLVQEDPEELALGLACADLQALMDDPRCEWVVGPDAPAALSRRWDALLEATGEAPAPMLGALTPGTQRLMRPGLKDVLEAGAGAAMRRSTDLKTRVESLYDGRDAAFWRERFEHAAEHGEPLRVLIPTTRHSTFIRHAAEDLRAAFERAGHDARVLIEHDAHARLSAISYRRALLEHRPDLVVSINFPRAALGDVMPAGVPMVCWVQDAMPHLFDPAVAGAQGPLDFVIGHMVADLVQTHGYDASRCGAAVVAADEAKFHDAPVPRELAARHECEVAYVSHHSETPEAMLERLLKEAGPGAAGALRSAHRAVLDAAQDPMQPLATATRFAEAGQTAAAALGDGSAATAARVVSNFLYPLLDRMLRHEMLAWAADACERNGWRLHIYGRGWEKHPRFGAYAKGDIAHGEDLRACYRTARAHLHASSTTLVHQRVSECVLSGGLCLLRLTRDALTGARTSAEASLARKTPDLRTERGDGYITADHAEAMTLMRAYQLAGVPFADAALWTSPARRAAQARIAHLLTPDTDANAAYGDVCEVGFTTRETLAEKIARAVASPAWRANASAMAASRVRGRLTHSAMVRSVLALVRRGLDAAHGAGV